MKTPNLRSPRDILPVLLLIFTLIPSITHAENWYINQFQVYPGLPQDWELTEDVKTLMGVRDEVPATIITEVEQYLHEVAVLYDRLGFRPPVLEPIVTLEDGSRAYRVYLGDYPDSEEPARYAGQSVSTSNLTGKISCIRQEKTYLRVDLSRAVKNGKMERTGLEHFGHELFHAVQSAYPLFSENCFLGDWIAEGTAEAMGIWAMYKVRGLQRPRNKPVTRWGGRRFNRELRVATTKSSAGDKDDAYGTQSLWRYIGEYVALGESPGVSPQTPDYRYLRRFFLENLAADPSTESELAWLDDAIKTELGVNLQRIFGQFVPTLVSYVSDSTSKRVEFTTKSRQVASDIWQKILFGACEIVTVVVGDGVSPLRLAFEKGAARCVEIKVTGPAGKGSLSINTLSGSLAHVGQITVGATGGNLVSLAETPAEDAKIPAYPGSWTFPIEYRKPNVFIITNLSPTAGDTDRIELDFEFSIPAYAASLNADTGSTTTAQRNAAQPTTTEDVAARARSGFHNPSKRSGGSVKAGRSKPEPDTICLGQDLADNLCGGEISIVLMASPDIIGDLGMTTGAGGALNKREGMAKGLFSMNSGEQMAQSQAYMDELMGTAGNMISISVPLVPYGYTGTFANAHISVGMGYGKTGDSVKQRGKGYRAVFVPAGMVTFEEYTPLMLRGTFSGTLLDLASITQGVGGEVQMSPPDTVRGSFVIPAPWKGDPDYRHEAESDLDTPMMDDIRQDLMGMIMMMPEELRLEGFIGKTGDDFCNMGFTEVQLELMKLAEACARIRAEEANAMLTSCSCTCENFEQERKVPLCEEQCALTWRQCSMVSPSTVATVEELEAIRSVFREYGYTEDMVEQYVELLRVAPPEARQALLDQLKPP